MVDILICTDKEKEWVKQAIVTNVRVYVRNVKTRKSDKKSFDGKPTVLQFLFQRVKCKILICDYWVWLLVIKYWGNIHFM